MVRPTDLLIRLRGVNETDTATSEAVENMEAVENAARRTSRETKKDWGGVTDLFSSVLPRGLQRTVRQFKSTNRSVGRLSKSFKVLKAAWASIGIGLIIIALEQIVENWDKITEALGYYNKEAEATKVLNQEIANDQAKLSRELIIYATQIRNIATSEIERAAAVEELNKALGGGIDVEADRETQMKQANALLEANNVLIDARKKAIYAENKAQKEGDILRASRYEDLNVLEKFEISAVEFRKQRDKEIRKLDNEAAKRLDIQIQAEAVLKGLIEETNSTIRDRNNALSEQELSERELAKIAADIARQAEADAKYLADLEKRISEEIMLAKIEDEQKRAEAELEIRHIEMLDKATLAGATSEQLLLIEDKYLMDLADLKESYREEDFDEKSPEQVAQEQQALQDEIFLALMNEKDREETLLMQKYDRRIELANGNHELELEAEKIFLADMEALTEDSEKKNQSIKEAGIKATVSAARGLFSTMGRMAEDGSEQAKALAITDVLLSQAVSLANGIKVATKSAATPYDMAAGIITAISAVMGAFVGVDAILNEAGTSSGGGGGGVPSTTPLVPEQVSRTETTGKAFVVQSDLEGAALQANQLYSQTALGGG